MTEPSTNSDCIFFRKPLKYACICANIDFSRTLEWNYPIKCFSLFFIPTTLTSISKTSKPDLFLVELLKCGSQLLLSVVAECLFRNLIWKWVKYNSE